jgi:hypothetical protein
MSSRTGAARSRTIFVDPMSRKRDAAPAPKVGHGYPSYFQPFKSYKVELSTVQIASTFGRY